MAIVRAGVTIDEGLNSHLGLPEGYPLDKKEAFSLYRYFMSMLETKKPVDGWVLLYYVDRHGNFVGNPKTKRDRIVKDIFDNLDMSSQFRVMTYISQIEEEI